MAGGNPKNKTKEHTLAKIANITCLKNQSAHLYFKILLLEENLNTFYLKQAESELPSVAERTYSEIFPLTKLPKPFV